MDPFDKLGQLSVAESTCRIQLLLLAMVALGGRLRVGRRESPISGVFFAPSNLPLPGIVVALLASPTRLERQKERSFCRFGRLGRRRRRRHQADINWPCNWLVSSVSEGYRCSRPGYSRRRLIFHFKFSRTDGSCQFAVEKDRQTEIRAVPSKQANHSHCKRSVN